MKVKELISILENLDPDKKVYVPFGEWMSPVTEPKITECYFRDRDGVLICSIACIENESE